jgi:PAS domain S-box-containing protein
MRSISLRVSLTLLLAAATVLTFLVVGTSILLVRLPQVEQRSRTQAQLAAENVQRLLDRYMEGLEGQLRPLAVLARQGSAESLQDHLDALVAEGSAFDAVSVLDDEGQVLVSGRTRQNDKLFRKKLEGMDFAGNSLFQALREQQRARPHLQRPVWSDRYLSVLSGQMIVGVALPAGSRTVVGEMAPEHILQLISGVELGDEGVVVIIDRRGRWLATTSAALLLPFQDYSDSPSFKAVMAHEPLPAYEDINGRRFLMGGSQTEKLGWVIAGGVPAGMLNYSYRMTLLLVLVGFAGAMAISVALAPLWAARLARPFRMLADRAYQIARGDFSQPTGRVGSITEFRRLAEDLDGMADAILEREAAMQRGDQRMKATLESTPAVAIQWFDIEGRVLYWNQASTELYGFGAQEAMHARLGDHPLMFGNAAGVAGFLEALRAIERTGLAMGPVEYQLTHKDGRTIHVLASTFSIPGDADQPIFVCMDIDITQRKQAEEALRNNELKLETIFNASPAPMSVSDARRDYRVVTVNRSWEQLFSRTREQVLGLSGTEIDFWENDEDRRRFLLILEQQGRVQDFEAWCHGGPGRTILCQISALITEIGGERLLLMMTVDITDRRRIELEIGQLNVELEQRVERRTKELGRANQKLKETIDTLTFAQAQLVESEKLAALGNLVAGVAHELNTPIGNGLMAISTLDERLKDFRRIAKEGLTHSELQRFSEAVEMACSISMRNLQRAATLVTSFKQVAVDQTSAQRRSFELREVVDEVLLTLQPTLRKTPWQVEVRVPQGLNLDSYPGALGQVLTNLVSNAVLHAFDGRATGTVTISAEAASGEEIVLRVQDDGSGVPVALQKKIFEPFFTTKMGQGGTGLGLHIVFNTVTRVLGGRIALHSDLHRGSTFELHLPCVAPGGEAPPGPGAVAEEGASA